MKNKKITGKNFCVLFLLLASLGFITAICSFAQTEEKPLEYEVEVILIEIPVCLCC